MLDEMAVANGGFLICDTNSIWLWRRDEPNFARIGRPPFASRAFSLDVRQPALDTLVFVSDLRCDTSPTVVLMNLQGEITGRVFLPLPLRDSVIVTADYRQLLLLPALDANIEQIGGHLVDLRCALACSMASSGVANLITALLQCVCQGSAASAEIQGCRGDGWRCDRG